MPDVALVLNFFAVSSNRLFIFECAFSASPTCRCGDLVSWRSRRSGLACTRHRLLRLHRPKLLWICLLGKEVGRWASHKVQEGAKQPQQMHTQLPCQDRQYFFRQVRLQLSYCSFPWKKVATKKRWIRGILKAAYKAKFFRVIKRNK